MRRVLLLAAVSSLSPGAWANPPDSDPAPASYYVAHGGSDDAPGTADAPWRTLSRAVARLRPGDTLRIRGGKAPDTNTACDRDGAQGGACWTETVPCGRGAVRCSPLHWTEGDPRWSGTHDRPITIAAAPGETVIVEPEGGRNVVLLSARTGGPAGAQVDAAHCSHLVFDGLILDGRHQTGDVFRVDPKTGSTDRPSTYCADIVLENGKVRHGHSNGGIAAYTLRGIYRNLEIYENGAAPGSNDHDHGVYLHAQHNVIEGGRVHHNIQGIQIENDDSNRFPEWRGDGVIRGVEVDHNGVNPFAGWADTGPGPFVRQRGKAANGDIALYTNDASYTLVEECRVHDNAWYGVTLAGQWGSPRGCGLATHHATVRNNRIWGNGTGDRRWPHAYFRSRYDAPHVCPGDHTSVVEGNARAPRPVAAGAGER